MRMRKMDPGDKMVMTDGSTYTVAPDGDWVYDGGIPLVTPGYYLAHSLPVPPVPTTFPAAVR